MSLPIPSSAQLLEDYKNAAERGAARALRAGQRISWAATSRWNIVRVATVRLCERVLFLLDDRFRASFLLTATGADLDAWAASEAPGYPRKPSSAATTRLTLHRSAGGTSGTIHAGDRFSTMGTSTVPAVTFAAMADVSVGSVDTDVSVDVACEKTGPGGNVDIGTITRVLTALFATFTATNSLPAAGGNDAEGDDEYRSRLQQRDARIRRGTTEAVRLGALSVPGVSRVVILDPTTGGTPDGTMLVVVGDQNGLGSEPMASAVDTALADWAPCGVRREVLPATVKSILDAYSPDTGIRVTITTSKASTVNQPSIETRARAALQSYFAGLQFQGTAHVAAWARAVLDVDREIRNVTFTRLPSATAITSDLSGSGLAPGQRWGVEDRDWQFVWGSEA